MLFSKKPYNFINPKTRPIWCAGCPAYLEYSIIAKALSEAGFNNKNTVVVSGIGCTGRMSGYFVSDRIHTTHGRAIPVAEGIKLANPKLNVIVISGDGDLLSIGGNHFLHTSRRNTNIKVFCNHNELYGMTGGQAAPTTKLGAKTKTTPTVNIYSNINTKSIITGNPDYFYARTSVSDPIHLKKSIGQSLKWKGFSYVEIHSYCVTHQKHLGSPIELQVALQKEMQNKLEIIHS